MKRFGFAVSFLALLVVSACEPAEPITIEGSTPQEAAELVSATSCEYFSTCGLITTTCSGNSADEDDGGGDDCEPEVVTVDYDECVTEGEDVLGDAFACADLDDEAIAVIDECLAEFQRGECVDPQDSEATEFGGMPEVCARALEPLLSCMDGGDTTSPSPPE